MAPGPYYGHCSTCTCCSGHRFTDTTRVIFVDEFARFGLVKMPSFRNLPFVSIPIRHFSQYVAHYLDALALWAISPDERSSYSGKIQRPIVPHLAWVGPARIAGLDIRRLIPRRAM